MELETGPHLAAGGDALSRAEDGRIVFVRGAAPGERVRVRITKDNARFLRAEVEAVLAPSPARAEPRCAHFAECGGCSLQHVSAEAQLESKQQALRETVARVGKVDLDRVEVAEPWAGAPYGYRTRARWSVSRDRAIGYRAEKSNRTVDVVRCPILAPELQEALTALRASVRGRGADRSRKGGRRPVEVEAVSNGERVLVALPPELARHADAVERAAGVPLRSDAAGAVDAEDGLGALALSPRVFAQGNRAGNRALVAHVAALLEGGPRGEVVELYAGSGNLTRALAGRADRVRAYEGSREAVGLARQNAPAHVEVHLAEVHEAVAALAAEPARPDVVVLDPPRAGVAEAALLQLASLQAERVLYISCNPATFARDIRLLEAHGYALEHLRLFDLYPQTGHSEVVGRLVRAA